MTQETRQAQSIPDGRRFWMAVGGIVAVLVVIWLLIPWQWSPVDDPGQVLTMRDLSAAQGPFGAILERIGQLASGDREGGVFRPLAWVYPPLIYPLPVRLAHTVRLLMLIAIVLGPLVYFRRKGASGPRLWMTLLLLVAGAATLYQGLLLLSVQEVGGMALVSLGFLSRNRTGRIALWTLAAWFKGPFSWVLIGYAVVLWREGHKRLAMASGGIGILTLAVNVWWSRGGTYSDRYRLNLLDPEIWKSAAHIVEPVNAFLLVAVLWWLVVTQTSLHRRPDFPLFAIAAFGYYVQMIPWGFTAYYMGPISFFLALLLASVLSSPDQVSGRQIVVALLLPALTAAWLTWSSLSFVFRTNAVMSDASECLSTVPGSTSVLFGDWLYVTSSAEGPIRIAQNTELFHPGWTGDVSMENNSVDVLLDDATTHAIALEGASLPAERPATEVCRTDLVTLYELK